MTLPFLGFIHSVSLDRAGLGSDRRFISTVSMRMDMLYFLGYDLDEELPSHSSQDTASSLRANQWRHLNNRQGQ